MNDYLDRLLSRSRGSQRSLQPRLGSRFEQRAIAFSAPHPVADLADAALIHGEALPDVDSLDLAAAVRAATPSRERARSTRARGALDPGHGPPSQSNAQQASAPIPALSAARTPRQAPLREHRRSQPTASRANGHSAAAGQSSDARSLAPAAPHRTPSGWMPSASTDVSDERLVDPSPARSRPAPHDTASPRAKNPPVAAAAAAAALSAAGAPALPPRPDATEREPPRSPSTRSVGLGIDPVYVQQRDAPLPSTLSDHPWDEAAPGMAATGFSPERPADSVPINVTIGRIDLAPQTPSPEPRALPVKRLDDYERRRGTR